MAAGPPITRDTRGRGLASAPLVGSSVDDIQEMATLFHVTGGYTYIDPHGVALGYEGVFTSSSRQADTTSRSASEKTVSGGWSGGTSAATSAEPPRR